MEVRSAIVGPGGDRRGELLERLRQQALLLVDGSEIVVRLGIVRIDPQGLLERRSAASLLALLQEQDAVVVMQVGLVRIERDRGLVVGSASSNRPSRP